MTAKELANAILALPEEAQNLPARFEYGYMTATAVSIEADAVKNDEIETWIEIEGAYTEPEAKE